MTELATRQATDLSIQPDQSNWTEKQKAALVQLGVKDASNADLAVFFHQAVRTGLDPFARQIYMIGRWSRDGVKQTIQTGIDGYRLIARRAADRSGESLGYEDTVWCGDDGQWREMWLTSDHPVAAKVAVLRGGQRFSAVAMWDEFVQTDRDGKPNAMWGRMKANQLAKCAEALALRKAFPQDLAGIYTDDEMGRAERHPADGGSASQPARVTSAEIVAPPVAVEAEPVTEQQEWPTVAEVPADTAEADQ